MAAIPAALPAVRPEVDTFATAGYLSVALDAETTRMLLGEVPAAFHAGVQDILLIAFGLAVAEFLGNAGAPIGIDVEGHGRHEELAPDLTCRARWGGSPPSTRCRWRDGRWAGLGAGGGRRGGVGGGDQGRQRAASGPAGPSDLRRAALPEHRVDLAGSDPPIGFNYLGRLGARRPRCPVICGGSARTDGR